MAHTRWQYKAFKLQGEYHTDYLETKLNELGQQGWEAVSMGWMIAGANGAATRPCCSSGRIRNGSQPTVPVPFGRALVQ